MGRMGIAIKRIYESPEARTGIACWSTVCGLRGMTKERAALDLWMRTSPPLPSCASGSGTIPPDSRNFAPKYIAELDANAAAEELLRICAEYPDVTLLYAAKDPQVNHALVLRDYLEDATAANETAPTRHDSREPSPGNDTNEGTTRMKELYIGSHLSTAGGWNALLERSHEEGGTAFAFFPRSPYGKRSRRSTRRAAAFGARLKAEGYGPLVVHAPYVYNLAGKDEAKRAFAIEALAETSSC